MGLHNITFELIVNKLVSSSSSTVGS